MPPKKFYNCNKIKFECEKEQKFREAQVWAAQGHKLHQRFKWSSVNCSMAIFGLLDYACLKVYFMHLNMIIRSCDLCESLFAVAATAAEMKGPMNGSSTRWSYWCSEMPNV